MIRCTTLGLLCFLLKSLIFSCLAANHYCTNGVMSPIRIDDSQNRDETIIPKILGDTDDSQQSYRSCRWRIESGLTTSDMQLVLQGVPPDSAPDGSSINRMEQRQETDFVVTYSEGKVIVKPGMFLVLPIGELLPFTAEASWDPKSQSPSQLKLRILLILPELCDRDMLGFNGSCYALTQVRANVTATMPNIRGNAQLASFASMSEISGLIAANAARSSVHPYRRPLNLIESVRLGMFYRSTDVAVVYAARDSGGFCSLIPVSKPQVFLASSRPIGNCLTLKVDASDKSVVEFNKCSTPMLALIKFPESRRSIASGLKSCSIGTVIDTVSKILQQDIGAESGVPTSTGFKLSPTDSSQLFNASEDTNQTNSASIQMPVLIVIIVIAILIFGITVIITIVLIRRKLARQAREADKEIQSEVIQPFIPSSHAQPDSLLAPPTLETLPVSASCDDLKSVAQVDTHPAESTGPTSNLKTAAHPAESAEPPSDVKADANSAESVEPQSNIQASTAADSLREALSAEALDKLPELRPKPKKEFDSFSMNNEFVTCNFSPNQEDQEDGSSKDFQASTLAQNQTDNTDLDELLAANSDQNQPGNLDDNFETCNFGQRESHKTDLDDLEATNSDQDQLGLFDDDFQTCNLWQNQMDSLSSDHFATIPQDPKDNSDLK